MSKVIDIASNDTVTRQQRRALERAEEKKRVFGLSAPSRNEIQQYVAHVNQQVLTPIVGEVQANTLAIELLAKFLAEKLNLFTHAELAEYIQTEMARLRAEQAPPATDDAPQPPPLPLSGPPEAAREASEELDTGSESGILLTDA